MSTNKTPFMVMYLLILLGAMHNDIFLSHYYQISPLLLIVNSTTDQVDKSPGDGHCKTSQIIDIYGMNDCTLRAAIMEANAHPGADTIIFYIDGKFTLTIPGNEEDGASSGDLDITDSLIIRGNGTQKTIIDGGGTLLNDRVLHIDPSGNGVEVSISYVAIQNGNANPADHGGAILNGICRFEGIPGCDPNAKESRLLANHIVIRSNSVAGRSYSSGGGIANNSYLQLSNSVIDGNNATVAGGIYNSALAVAELDQVVINSNTASLNTQGTPLIAAGGLYNSGTADMTIKNSKLTNNRAPTGSGGGIDNHGTLKVETTEIRGNESGYWGGGIFNAGVFDAVDLTIKNNTAQTSGGGIFNNSSARLTLNRVSISGNSTKTGNFGGGGIRNIGSMDLKNVTISNNVTSGSGGGIFNTPPAVAVLTNVTIFGNQARYGGGIRNTATATSIMLTNTIVANNSPGSNCNGDTLSNGHNLDSENSCGFNSAGDLTNKDPFLLPLDDNGGFSQTHRMGTGYIMIFVRSGPRYRPQRSLTVSAAMDAGDNATCPPTDQRGVPRPEGKQCDIGAYEFP